ncbi:ABC-type Na+ efflux pump permease subunit [Breznakia sp. PF5-3]|uniref:hypothetical protein n=1 Tax=unclassified Breznakia TaxID=2623764 RepID=UPI00240717E1|nr:MULTISPECIES: hypothetical protein [unclassified Breznakia]MDF9823761.1 ABC-type Na+ efflux pump permease subunit [Breznakia sp. PM6-1]MDF9834559.1 ABC-type Na+ efflux pump permease subunit [Breznakia sp. PF5-3]MDF9838248.1 ABC-type Na+ efflux pump permease subunit [Breznakia sp. PFB2-8]MDF9860264.1 ABC-type Na+ efflux pump permease subunit [Breznakia sp. PH5-24]
MALKKKKLKTPKNTGQKKTNKRRPNWILRFTLIVIAVPLIILAWVLMTSLETSGEPVVGNRFDNQLDPAITEKKVDELKGKFTYAEAENVEVNLKSATLRITIDVADATTDEQITAIMNDVYAKVDETLPIATYFTNKKAVKMYDLEINVYNYIPDDTNRAGYIYHLLTKNAGNDGPEHSIPSQPKNQSTADDLKKAPKKGEQVGQ